MITLQTWKKGGKVPPFYNQILKGGKAVPTAFSNVTFSNIQRDFSSSANKVTDKKWAKIRTAALQFSKAALKAGADEPTQVDTSSIQRSTNHRANLVEEDDE